MWLCCIEPRSWRRYVKLFISLQWVFQNNLLESLVVMIGQGLAMKLFSWQDHHNELFPSCLFQYCAWGFHWNCLLCEPEQEGEGEWFFDQHEVMSNVIGGDHANNHIDLAEVNDHASFSKTYQYHPNISKWDLYPTCLMQNGVNVWR